MQNRTFQIKKILGLVVSLFNSETLMKLSNLINRSLVTHDNLAFVFNPFEIVSIKTKSKYFLS